MHAFALRALDRIGNQLNTVPHLRFLHAERERDTAVTGLYQSGGEVFELPGKVLVDKKNVHETPAVPVFHLI